MSQLDSFLNRVKFIITVDLTTFQGQIEFNTLFKSSKISINVDEFNLKFPMLQQYQRAFETDKDIFNAFVTKLL